MVALETSKTAQSFKEWKWWKEEERVVLEQEAGQKITFQDCQGRRSWSNCVDPEASTKCTTGVTIDCGPGHSCYPCQRNQASPGLHCPGSGGLWRPQVSSNLCSGGDESQYRGLHQAPGLQGGPLAQGELHAPTRLLGTSNRTQEWLTTNMANFWPMDVWHPSSPDLNPLDYSVWSVLESRACKSPHNSVNALKASIVRSWQSLSKQYIVDTCLSFRRRVETVFEMECGLLEKLYLTR